MTKCTLNLVSSNNIATEDRIITYIVDTANHAIAMYSKRETMHFLLYLEEQLVTLLPIAKMLNTGNNAVVSAQIEITIDRLQRGQSLRQISLGNL